MAPEEIVRRLDHIPIISSEAIYRERSYLVTKQLFNGGLSVKLYPEGLGERDFISLNHYRTNAGDHLKPCEMSSENRMHNSRCNPDWMRDPLDSEPAHSVALRDLRELLLGGLCRAIGRKTPEDSVQICLVKVLHGHSSFNDTSRFTTCAMSIPVRTVPKDLRAERWGNVSLDQIGPETGRHWTPPETSSDNASQTINPSRFLLPFYGNFRKMLSPIILN